MLRKILALTTLLLMGAQGWAQQGGIVKDIVVRGNIAISRDAILAAMKSKEGRPFVQADLPTDESQIKNLGFFQDVKVLSRNTAADEWEIIVEVLENPVVKEIRITGNTVFPTDQLLKLVTQPVGQLYNLRNALPTTDAISKLYEEKGYFAQVDIVPLPDSPGTLNIVVVERQVKDIYIEGLVRTRPTIIRRLMKVKPGQAYNEEAFGTDLRRLGSTQWFETITPRVREAGEIGKVDLLIDLKEARTAQIGVGLSLDPTSRLTGSLRYADTNFRGSGQTVAVTLSQDTSGAGPSAAFDYANPFFDDKDSSIAVSIYSKIQSYFAGSGFGAVNSPNDDRFDERRTGGTFSFARPFDKVYSGSIGLTAQAIKTVNLRSTGTSNFIQQDGSLAYLALGVARDTRDVPLDPAQGDYASLIIEPGVTDITKIGGGVGDATNVLGQHSFVRSTFEYKHFWSRKPKKRKLEDVARNVIAFRLKAGSISGTVPFFEQYFAGGSDSLRGYADQRYWGKQTLLTTLEYRIPIQKSFSLIPFVDYGGAWGGYGSLNDFSQSNNFKLHFGYGAGVAFRTPLGAIRIDFGINETGGTRTHLSIGGNF